MVKPFYVKILIPGDYCLGTRFDCWPDEACQAMLDHIEREQVKSGADPNLEERIYRFAVHTAPNADNRRPHITHSARGAAMSAAA
jgi:hypothetical protein